MIASGISVGLDVGTEKTCAAVIETRDAKSRVLGVSSVPASGMRKGSVADVASAAESIRAAVAEASVSSGTRIRKVTLGVSGTHVASSISYGVVGVSGRDVTERDRRKAIGAAGIFYVPVEREILHVIPAEFILDGAEGVRNPVGMPAFRLEARVLVVTAAAAEVQKLGNACREAGVQVDQAVCSTLATAGAVLTERERNEGAILVDVGAGTTGVAVFQNGTPRQCAVLGVGGAHITNDLAVGLRLTFSEAEKLKQESVTFKGPKRHECGEGAATLGHAGALQIAGARIAEIIELVESRIEGFGCASGAPFSTVVTGGTALLGGFADMAGKILGMPARVGNPLLIQGLKHEARTPAFSGALGLGLERRREREQAADETAADSVHDGARSAVHRVTGFLRSLNFDKNKKGVRYV